jgi:hypothetical protein
MSGWPDIEHLQELVVRLSPEDAELINRLERTRLTLEFMLAGIRRPSTHEESGHDCHGAGDRSSRGSTLRRLDASQTD